MFSCTEMYLKRGTATISRYRWQLGSQLWDVILNVITTLSVHLRIVAHQCPFKDHFVCAEDTWLLCDQLSLGMLVATSEGVSDGQSTKLSFQNRTEILAAGNIIIQATVLSDLT